MTTLDHLTLTHKTLLNLVCGVLPNVAYSPDLRSMQQHASVDTQFKTSDDVRKFVDDDFIVWKPASFFRDGIRGLPERDGVWSQKTLDDISTALVALPTLPRQPPTGRSPCFTRIFSLLQMPEEEAFAVLVQLMNEYRLREFYKPCMTELGVCMHQLDGLIAEHLPELHTHFTTQAFAPSHYASAWFLTLFATAFPLPMTTRVMDLFIAEGMEFILRLSLAILKQFAPRLLTMDMETMIFVSC
uniref:Rab-GAP TBC domain-containing protein n=1 Tax=Mesocestoides corti TaxID=53468 RepID=A0A5K3FZM5_MESCO